VRTGNAYFSRLLAVSATHPFLDYATGKHQRLGNKALRLFQNADRRDGSALIIVPTIVLAESFNIIQSGRVKIQPTYEDWVASLKKHKFLSLYRLEVEEVMQASKLTGLDDPYDRMIVGTALQLDLPLITKDERITESRLVETVWDD
jgi:PIN domain nuclease of toxin-antitoxin system